MGCFGKGAQTKTGAGFFFVRVSYTMKPVPKTLLLVFLLAVSLAGCRREVPQPVQVAPGVTFRRDHEAGVQLLDVDLTEATVRPVVVANHIERRRVNIIGDCQTVRDWAEDNGAVGGINGGFFGDTYDQVGRRKQIVGLAVVDGKVIAPYGFTNSTKNPGEHFLRGAVGFDKNGTPDIAWVTGTLSKGLQRYEAPVNPSASSEWPVVNALGCGPRLFVGGVAHVFDKEERRVSPGKLARCFIAYDRDETTGKPQHLILGRADAMEFTDIAQYLTDYFDEVHQTRPHDALCMDGGPSAQLVYKNEHGTLEDAEPTGVLVPTAILLVPK